MLDDVKRQYLERAKLVLQGRQFIRVRVFCKMMNDGIIWQHAVMILQELGWHKFNGYQWAAPTVMNNEKPIQ